MSVLPGAVIESSSSYSIANSVRFRSSASAYFSRTFGTPTNNLKWTWSGWVKRGGLGAHAIFGADTGGSVSVWGGFYSSDEFRLLVAGTANYVSTPVYRDPSAWMHVVFVYDSANATQADRTILYINGTRQTATTNNLTLNQATNINANAKATFQGYVGWAWFSDARDYLDGYLSDVYFIDGQALTPSSFGEQSSDGVWVPKAYTGTYGNNGFHLDFSDGTSATTLGYDAAGSNDWTPSAGISTTAGVTYDWMTDTPTNNYATLNPLSKCYSATVGQGGLALPIVTTYGNLPVLSTIGVSSGKWYFEFSFVGTMTGAVFGVAKNTIALTTSAGNGTYLGYGTDSWALLLGYTCNKLTNNASAGGGTSYIGTSALTGEVCCCALDMDSGKIWWRLKDGAWGGAAGGDPEAGTGEAYSGITGTVFPAADADYRGDGYINFGQRPFAYTPPTGFKSLCTANLPAVAITNPSAHFDIETYTGTAATKTFTGLLFQPDMVWMKSRGRTLDHAIYDAVRGVEKRLESNNTDAEVTGDTTGLTAFTSDGWTIGALDQINGTTATNSFVGWAWKGGNGTVSNTAGSITSTVSANTTAGFSIVTYTGTGANATVGHGLGVAPKMVITKCRGAGTTSWAVYHANLTSAAYYLLLDSTAAQASSSTVWNSTAPTSTVFSVASSTATNYSTMVAYCFAEIAGFSKFGSYTGNGSTDGTFVYCGFRPRYIMVKCSSGYAGYWAIFDVARGTVNASSIPALWANAGDAEGAYSTLDITSSGFKVRDTSATINQGSATYIFAAFAEYPFGGSNVAPAPAR